tara:strand:- start:1097 stop:1279 length:183 start_codon:yes stop_codon:yes gene_type:complete
MYKKVSDMSDNEIEEYMECQLDMIEEVNQILRSLLERKKWEITAEAYFMWMYGTEPFAES